MWIADQWKDYEVIDTSNGEKLERWGKYLLVRPDPQVIWDTPRQHRGWKRPNGHYHRSKKGGGEWEFFDLPISSRSASSIRGFSRNRRRTGTGFLRKSAMPDARSGY